MLRRASPTYACRSCRTLGAHDEQHLSRGWSVRVPFRRNLGCFYPHSNRVESSAWCTRLAAFQWGHAGWHCPQSAVLARVRCSTMRIGHRHTSPRSVCVSSVRAGKSGAGRRMVRRRFGRQACSVPPLASPLVVRRWASSRCCHMLQELHQWWLRAPWVAACACTPNHSIERTANGGQWLRASATSVAPLSAAHVERWASRVASFDANEHTFIACYRD